jgi:PAS domain S-box-containing protein
VVYWNNRAEAVFGYGSAEAIGQSLNELVDPPDQPTQEREDPRQTLETGIVTIEAVRQRNDGSVVYVDISSKAVRNTEGEIEFLLSSIKDVTDLKVLRDAKFVHSQFGSLLESTPDGIVMANLTGRIVFTNSQADKLLGYERKELRGKLVEELLPERFRGARLDHPGYLAAFFAEPCTRAMGAGLELYALRKDGSEFPVEISLSPFETEAGILVFGTIRDITERKHAEEVLRQSEERFRLLVEGVQEYAIFMLSPQGNVVSWNKGAERIKGYKVDEIIGKHFSCFYTPEAIAQGKPEEELRIAMEHGQMSEEGWRLRKDGQKFWTSVVITALFDKAGCLQGFAKISRDMTEAKQVERALNDKNIKLQKNAQELARSNKDLQQFQRTLDKTNIELQNTARLKDRFVANMSHELRTPLNGIIGFAEFLADGKPGTLNPKQKEYLEDILKSGKHLLQLLNDVLDLAKVQAGKMELNAGKFSLRAIIEEVCAVTKPMAKKKGISVEVYIAHELGDITLDQRKFKQVLYNLLSNALKFTGDGGNVKLFAEPREPHRFKLVVKDTGIGIKPEDLGRLFKEFEQLESDVGQRQEGTGLGLALTWKIVELLGGKIDVESEIGKGSSFTIELPLVHGGS